MNEQSASWDDLRIVLAIGRSGSLSGAAREMGTSHPTVFRHIGRIEKRLGVRLFERARTGYTPTSAGEELLGLAAGIETKIGDSERRLLGLDLRASGTVRVTTTDTLLGLLTPVFAALRAVYPDITVELAISNEMFDLRKRDADIAIRPTRTPPESLVGRKVATISMAVYAPAGVEGADLGWVGPDDSLSQLPLTRWLTVAGHDREVVYRANSLLAMLEAVRVGIGCAVLPCFMGDMASGVMRRGAPIADLAGELWFLTHPDLRRVARVRAVLDFLAKALRLHAPLMAGRQSG